MHLEFSLIMAFHLKQTNSPNIRLLRRFLLKKNTDKYIQTIIMNRLKTIVNHYKLVLKEKQTQQLTKYEKLICSIENKHYNNISF